MTHLSSPSAGLGWCIPKNSLKMELPQSMTASEQTSTSKCALLLVSTSALSELVWSMAAARTQSNPCLDRGVTAAAVQLGQPPTNTYRLQLCDSQDVRKPFKPLQLETDCWHRCAATDRVGPAAKIWIQDIIKKVRHELQETVRILWCVSCLMCTCSCGSCIALQMCIESETAIQRAFCMTLM